MNWNKTKLRELNWNGQNLEDWIEIWPNLEGVICNLAKKKNDILFLIIAKSQIKALCIYYRRFPVASVSCYGRITLHPNGNRIFSIWKSLHLFFSWFRFYFRNLMVYKVSHFKWRSLLYIVKSKIFNLDHEMETLHFISNGEIIIHPNDGTILDWDDVQKLKIFARPLIMKVFFLLLFF